MVTSVPPGPTDAPAGLGRDDPAPPGAARRRESLTPPVKRVLDLLRDAGKPVKAYDLVARFAPHKRTPGPTVVYRALAVLLRQGLVHRIESQNTFVACEHADREHTPGFLICDRCGATEEHDLDRLPPFAAGHRTTITRVVVEATYLCGQCAA